MVVSERPRRASRPPPPPAMSPLPSSPSKKNPKRRSSSNSSSGRKKSKNDTPSPRRGRPPTKGKKGVVVEEVKETYWEVDSVVGRRVQEGVVQYRIRWKGCTAADDTWEPEANLTDAALEEGKEKFGDTHNDDDDLLGGEGKQDDDMEINEDKPSDDIPSDDKQTDDKPTDEKQIDDKKDDDKQIDDNQSGDIQNDDGDVGDAQTDNSADNEETTDSGAAAAIPTAAETTMAEMVDLADTLVKEGSDALADTADAMSVAKVEQEPQLEEDETTTLDETDAITSNGDTAEVDNMEPKEPDDTTVLVKDSVVVTGDEAATMTTAAVVAEISEE